MGKLEVNNYPKNKQPIFQQPKIKPLKCPICRQNIWLEFDKRWYCRNCEYIINKQKHQMVKKILGQDKYFSTRLPYANKKTVKTVFRVRVLCSLAAEDACFRMRVTLGVVLIRSLVGHVCVPEYSRNGFGMRPYLLVEEKLV